MLKRMFAVAATVATFSASAANSFPQEPIIEVYFTTKTGTAYSTLMSRQETKTVQVDGKSYTIKMNGAKDKQDLAVVVEPKDTVDNVRLTIKDPD